MANSLLAPSTLPFELPDYAHLTDADFREALEVGMSEQLAELDAIATDPEPATVASVLEAWERSGATLRRAQAAFGVARAADTNPERDAIEKEMAPRLAAHADTIALDPRLYARLRDLLARAESGEVGLDEQESYLLSKRLEQFERGGIALTESDQARLREINTRIAVLATEFDHLLVAGRNAAGVLVTEPEELAGLSDDDLAAAAQAATEAGHQGGWLLNITNTTGQPVLAALSNRDTRRRVHLASTQRGLGGDHHGGKHDTRAVLLEIAHLRDERAHLLGYPHHAAYVAHVGCAGTTDAVNDILGRLGRAAFDSVRARGAQLQAKLTQLEPGATLEPWDWAYVEALLRADEASFDEGLVRPYLEFERVLIKGVFAAATALYGITFAHREELVGYTEQAQVYEVCEADGAVLGAVVIDPYTRPTKQGGAWMTSIVPSSELLGTRPVVTNTCNFPPPAPGAPSLLSWDNVITLFHEFGHDLHGLLSKTRFPSRAGTATPRDFVEFPSQVNEIWATDPTLLADYARHHETGAALPAEFAAALSAGGKADTYRYAELIAAAVVDQAWHQTPAAQLPSDPAAVEEFERAALAAAGIDYSPVPPRYRSTYFHHIFGGGYSAGYYSYLWSEIFDADTVAWFADNGGLARAPGERFRRLLLGRGGSIDSLAAYREFRGADPDLRHLIERMGVTVS